MNSTGTAYSMGQFGSTYLTGDGAKLDLSMATSKYYIVSITITESATFEHLNVMDRGINLGMGNTYFVSTDGPYPLDTDWGGLTGADVTNEANEDSDQVTNTHQFPAGITLHGMWEKVELNSGACVAYVAPRPDYKDRA